MYLTPNWLICEQCGYLDAKLIQLHIYTSSVIEAKLNNFNYVLNF